MKNDLNLLGLSTAKLFLFHFSPEMYFRCPHAVALCYMAGAISVVLLFTKGKVLDSASFNTTFSIVTRHSSQLPKQSSATTCCLVMFLHYEGCCCPLLVCSPAELPFLSSHTLKHHQIQMFNTGGLWLTGSGQTQCHMISLSCCLFVCFLTCVSCSKENQLCFCFLHAWKQCTLDLFSFCPANFN